MSSLLGRTWQNWSVEDEAEDEDIDEFPHPTSPRSAVTITSSSSGTATPLNYSPSQSPGPSSRHQLNASSSLLEDVMKLPSRDMKIFGQCPVQDEFVLVVCDICHRSLKLEAFGEHYRLRHERSAVGETSKTSLLVSKSNRATRNVTRTLRPCTVELTKEDLAPISSTSSSSPFSSTQTTPSNSRASSTHSAPLKPSATPSPLSLKEELEEPMETEDIKPSTTQPSLLIKNEESSNNVISIPDSEPLPHAMSNDLMAMVSGDLSPAVIVKDEVQQQQQQPQTRVQIEPSTNVIKLQLNTTQKPPSTSPLTSLGLTNRPKFPQMPIQIIDPTQASPSKKLSPSKKSSGRGDRKPLREYHPDRHCGVWDNDGKRNCTRALTCKSHSVLLKRKIAGRSKPFDELVAEYKASKEAQALAAMAVATAQRQIGQMTAPLPPPSLGGVNPMTTVPINVEDVLNSITEPNPIETTRYQQQQQAINNSARPKVLGPSGWSPVTSVISMSSKQHQQQIFPSSQYNGNIKVSLSKEADENLHYTTDHPKPLSVCSFGARRLGGLFVADRSQFLTRKLVRVAITSNGLRLKNVSNSRYHPLQNLNKKAQHLLQPRGTQIATQGGSGAGSYLVNCNLTTSRNSKGFAQPTIVTSGGPMPRIIQMHHQSDQQNSGGMPGVVSTSSTSSISHINIAASSESSFKTDIQDFKGGIKFELGRKIKPILPSGANK